MASKLVNISAVIKATTYPKVMVGLIFYFSCKTHYALLPCIVFSCLRIFFTILILRSYLKQADANADSVPESGPESRPKR